MLASLFRGSSGQRNSQHIESVTDDAHTRSLLFGQAQQVFNLTTSPPPSPFGSPTIRGGSFDDRAGIDLEERDVRVLLAQDVYSGEERPRVLFDNRRPQDTYSHEDRQHPTRSPLPSTWRPSQGSKERQEETLRNRSSTFSESHSSWSKANKDVSSKDDAFLECMFGAPSSTKMSSSTKMHVIPAKNRQSYASERLQKRPGDARDPGRRGPLARSHTSGHQTMPTLDLDNRDALLVTRLFHIALDENVKIVNTKENAQNQDGRRQPAKLVERRAPAYAIGLVIQLPAHRPHSSHIGVPRSSSYGQSLTSANSSFGSDLQSSWTFLDAIPTSLSSSIAVGDESDRRLDIIVDNWDVILRTISHFERIATRLVDKELQRVIRFESEAQLKTPKGKLTRRDNQRIVGISDVACVAQSSTLRLAANDVARRIAYAIRVPRVLTGVGFVAGHWTDEARMLHRVCGGRQQNFFFFNLLTAFLGNNVQWLERLAPEWYRKQYLESHRKSPEISTLACRTVVVSEHKGLARRLIYILASFLPSADGTDGFRQGLEDSPLTASLSPTRRIRQSSQSRRPSKPYIKEANPARDFSSDLLGTSASSRISQNSLAINSSPRKQMLRKDSNRFDIGGNGIRTMLDASAGTSSAIVPHALETPTAYLSVRESYFPESAIVETNDSIATADLSRVLNRASSTHRRTSSASSRWGSLVSGISEMWSAKPSSSVDRGSVTTASHEASPAYEHKRASSAALSINRSSNPLQMMVDELDQNKCTALGFRSRQGSADVASPRYRSSRAMTSAPRLQVDEKDGVIDVEIDLPGFISATNFATATSSARKFPTHPASSEHGGTSSVSSLRSVIGKASRYPTGSLNVGGYLRRHHEDFMLHAVRPYNDLHEDIRRSMRAEPTSQDLFDQILRDTSSMVWVSICTTLVADTRNYSILRFTLRRQYEIPLPESSEERSHTDPSAYRRSKMVMRHEEIAEDKVMEFDATLADAIEKLLSVGSLDATRSGPGTRTHSRNVSSGSSRTNQLLAGDLKHTTLATLRTEPSRIDQRDLVVAALEDVVRSVNAGLDREPAGCLPGSGNPRQNGSPRQENALREGVRKWMIDVEHTSHAVW